VYERTCPRHGGASSRCTNRGSIRNANRTDKEVQLYERLGFVHAAAARRLAHARKKARPEPGQGTVEYVALVLLVSLVMFGVVAAMKTYKFSEGQELGDLIVKKIKDAVSKVRY
jgi:hypothetical protein